MSASFYMVIFQLEATQKECSQKINEQTQRANELQSLLADAEDKLVSSYFFVCLAEAYQQVYCTVVLLH